MEKTDLRTTLANGNKKTEAEVLMREEALSVHAKRMQETLSKGCSFIPNASRVEQE